MRDDMNSVDGKHGEMLLRGIKVYYAAYSVLCIDSLERPYPT